MIEIADDGRGVDAAAVERTGQAVRPAGPAAPLDAATCCRCCARLDFRRKTRRIAQAGVASAWLSSSRRSSEFSGTMTLETTPGAGTRFIIQLPRHARDHRRADRTRRHGIVRRSAGRGPRGDRSCCPRCPPGRRERDRPVSRTRAADRPARAAVRHRQHGAATRFHVFVVGTRRGSSDLPSIASSASAKSSFAPSPIRWCASRAFPAPPTWATATWY